MMVMMMMMMMIKFHKDFLRLISSVYFRFEKNKTTQSKKLILKRQKIKELNCNNVERGENSRWRWKHGHGFLDPN